MHIKKTCFVSSLEMLTAPLIQASTSVFMKWHFSSSPLRGYYFPASKPLLIVSLTWVLLPCFQTTSHHLPYMGTTSLLPNHFSSSPLRGYYFPASKRLLIVSLTWVLLLCFQTTSHHLPYMGTTSKPPGNNKQLFSASQISIS